MENTNFHNAENNDGGLTRRELLRAASVSLLGAGLMASGVEAVALPRPVRAGRAERCIVLNLTGGMGHLDTWDMKPGAPKAMRGPFQPIPTDVPGMEICEIFPRMARHADKFALVRSMYTPATAPTEQMEPTVQGTRRPNAATLPAQTAAFPPRDSEGAFGLPFDLNASGLNASGLNGANAFFAAPWDNGPNDIFRPVMLPWPSSADLPRLPSRVADALRLDAEPDRVRDRYGRCGFGQSCLRARRLVERGVRFVSIEMYPDAYHAPRFNTWDAHGSAPFADLTAYRTHCGPHFDNAYTGLIEDLCERGLYDSTIVLATGLWGRAPLVNRYGGRGRWPHCWSLLIGGGGLKGGQVIGASDDLGGYPVERPATTDDIAATLRFALDRDARAQSAKWQSLDATPACSARPLWELF